MKQIISRIKLKEALIFTGLFLALLLKRGYYFGINNHPMFVPSLYKIARPDFLKGDWYINALVPYHYTFKFIYAKLLNYISLPVLFFISYCIALYLIILGFKKL